MRSTKHVTDAWNAYCSSSNFENVFFSFNTIHWCVTLTRLFLFFPLSILLQCAAMTTGPRPGDDTAVVLDVTTQILASLDFPYRCKVWCLSHRGFTVSVFLRSIGWSNIWCWYLVGQSSYREKLDSSPGGIKLFCFEGSGGGTAKPRRSS